MSHTDAISLLSISSSHRNISIDFLLLNLEIRVEYLAPDKPPGT